MNVSTLSQLRPTMKPRFARSLWFCVGAFICRAAFSETVSLTPAADTTLHQKFPENNIGGHFDFAAGAVASGERTRALLRFDLNGKVPAGATIQSASLALRVTRQPSSGGVDSAFELHRVNQPWTEGTQTSSSGLPAAPGETTWNTRSNPDIPWSAPGGVIGNDFGADVSASIDVTGRGAYTFASTPTLVRDVQFWLEEPNSNFGWVLLSRDEDKPETARRFASREDPVNTPMLTIEFTTGSNELRLTAINVDSSQVTLSWIGGIGPFQAQARSSLSLPWEDIGTPVAAAPVALPLFGRMSFFRIRQATNVPGSPPPGQTNTPPSEPPPPPPPLPADSAEYEVVFKSDWSPATHPQSFPLGAHWSPLIGGTHNTNVTFWQEGVVATQGIEDVAELGNIVALRREVNTAITDGTANAVLTRPGSISPSSSAAITFTAQRDFPLVTLVTMIAPSPDWFTGVHGLSLIENGQWVDQKVVVLDLYDAGTDSGVTYSSLDADTQPREVIRKITGFPALVNGQLVPFGTFTFTRR